METPTTLNRPRRRLYQEPLASETPSPQTLDASKITPSDLPPKSQKQPERPVLEERLEPSEMTIRQYAHWATGTQFVRLPFLGALAIGNLQERMLRELAQNHQAEFNRVVARLHLAAFLGETLGRKKLKEMPLSRWTEKIPGLGLLVGGISQEPDAKPFTYAVGKVFEKHFSDGGTLLNFRVQDCLDEFEQAYAQCPI